MYLIVLGCMNFIFYFYEYCFHIHQGGFTFTVEQPCKVLGFYSEELSWKMLNINNTKYHNTNVCVGYKYGNLTMICQGHWWFNEMGNIIPIRIIPTSKFSALLQSRFIRISCIHGPLTKPGLKTVNCLQKPTGVYQVVRLSLFSYMEYHIIWVVPRYNQAVFTVNLYYMTLIEIKATLHLFLALRALCKLLKCIFNDFSQQFSGTSFDRVLKIVNNALFVCVEDSTSYFELWYFNRLLSKHMKNMRSFGVWRQLLVTLSSIIEFVRGVGPNVLE